MKGDLFDFREFFQLATGFRPYPYQERFARSKEIPSVVSVPTGMGKTAGVILSWLWRRRFTTESQYTPRRLVYCLPMRVLVEQTVKNAENWLKKLDLLAGKNQGSASRIGVFPLLGGEVENNFDFFPERESIIVGTQDMLLSRALNRGYGMSRFRWPVHFALLNNDCLWIMDEVQLMGAGLATTTQLDAFRRRFGTFFPVKSVWMSATLKPDWLATVDFDPDRDAASRLSLDADDLDHGDAVKRLSASKALVRAMDETVSKDGRSEAERILAEHKPGTLTLVVVNTVPRALILYKALKKRSKDGPELVLIHSRFRPPDRAGKIERLMAEPSEAGLIVVTTQVVEAGVDVSAATLFTDLAPWPSLVQRFGRCNRYGLVDDARIFWFDLDLSQKGAALPYEPDCLETSRSIIKELSDAGPGKLPQVDDPFRRHQVIRGPDMIDLFDTTPDLAGADVDVSRFIRESDDRDVLVFWRDLSEEGPAPGEPSPLRHELCPAPLRDLLSRTEREKWRWDHLERRWVRAGGLYPGTIVMLRASEGGYSGEKGYTGDKNDLPSISDRTGPVGEANDDDPVSYRNRQSLVHHTEAVAAEVEALMEILPITNERLMENLRFAARWHDAGKVHFIFQRSAGGEEDAAGMIWAKAPSFTRYARPGFRHELASALAMIQAGLPDLAAYLAAAHHGKVRLSIRSLPHELAPNDPEQRYARGLWDGDPLGPADLGAGSSVPHFHLDLSLMEIGDGTLGESWTARMLALRDDLGPFKLAFLETILRLADWRASASKEADHA